MVLVLPFGLVVPGVTVVLPPEPLEKKKKPQITLKRIPDNKQPLWETHN